MFEREDKNLALSQILQREGGFQASLLEKSRETGHLLPQEKVELHFIPSEQIMEIPEDYTFFI